MQNFQSYLEKPNAMSFEEMDRLHNAILQEIGGDEDALDLFADLQADAAAYAEIRSQWLLMSREEQGKKDARRTSCHDAVISDFNILARYLKQQGKSAEWRERLGDETADRFARKTIGDFGCYLAFVNALCAR